MPDLFLFSDVYLAWTFITKINTLRPGCDKNTFKKYKTSTISNFININIKITVYPVYFTLQNIHIRNLYHVFFAIRNFLIAKID